MKQTIKILVALTAIYAAALPAHADVYVNGYLRSNGTPVAAHYRSNPDGALSNNWSTYPNVNPYTGAIGTRSIPSYSKTYSWTTPSKTSPTKSTLSGLPLLCGITVLVLLISSSAVSNKKEQQ